jgi:hypothetical protein
MRAIPLVAITFAALALCTIGARADGTWCAHYGVPHTNCGFYSFQQCMAAISGNGGFCQPNPFSVQPMAPRGNREGAIGATINISGRAHRSDP